MWDNRDIIPISLWLLPGEGVALGVQQACCPRLAVVRTQSGVAGGCPRTLRDREPGLEGIGPRGVSTRSSAGGVGAAALESQGCPERRLCSRARELGDPHTWLKASRLGGGWGA